MWQLGKAIAIKVYTETNKFPQTEMFGLRSQMRRSSVSIPSNIAEGFNRLHLNEHRQFLYVALGSCAEIESQIEMSAELQYINNARKLELLEKLNHETRMIRNLIKKL